MEQSILKKPIFTTDLLGDYQSKPTTLIISLYDYPYGGYSAHEFENGSLTEINLSKDSFDYCDSMTTLFIDKNGLIKPDELIKYDNIIISKDGRCTIIK